MFLGDGVADLVIGYGLLIVGSTFGELAAIAAWSLKSLVYIPLSAYCVRRFADVSFIAQTRAVWPPLLASTLMLGATALAANLAGRVSWLQHPALILLTQGALGAAVYVTCIVAFAPQDLHSVAQKVLQPLRLRLPGHNRGT